MRKHHIDRLIVVGKQAVALICFERFCKKYALKHPFIDNYINHVWRITKFGDKEFDFNQWVKEFSCLEMAGLCDPLPQEFIEYLPREIIKDFEDILMYVTEITAINTADNTASTLRRVRTVYAKLLFS